MKIILRNPVPIEEVDFEEAMQTAFEGRKEAFGSGIMSFVFARDYRMLAARAGVFEEIYKPAKQGITKAHQLVMPLRLALQLLEREPARFHKKSDNKIQFYVSFRSLVGSLLNSCEIHPNALLEYADTR